MDRFMKAFVFASLGYLLAGSAIGMAVGMAPSLQAWRFAHVHFNLLGFMAMMIYGVGYFIIPRFNSTVLRWNGLVGVHFWLANLSLIVMCGARVAYETSGEALWGAMFGIASAVQFLSIVLFVVHLGYSVWKPKPAASARTATPSSAPVGSPGPSAFKPGGAPAAIGPDMPVGEIITRWPAAVPVLVDAGLRALADPEHRQMVVRAGVPLRMACMKHGVDLAALLPKLQAAAGQSAPGGVPDDAWLADAIIDDVLSRHPATEAVLLRFYGEGCFSCPGQKMETVRQSALMHNVPLDSLLQALREAIAG